MWIMTDNAPSRKTEARPNFFNPAICRDVITGIGIAKMTQSHKAFQRECAYQNAIRLMQSPGVVSFHARYTGVHWKTVVKVKAIAPKMTFAIMNLVKI